MPEGSDEMRPTPSGLGEIEPVPEGSGEILIITKRKSFEGYKDNIKVLKAYTKCWFVVSQRSKV